MTQGLLEDLTPCMMEKPVFKKEPALKLPKAPEQVGLVDQDKLRKFFYEDKLYAHISLTNAERTSVISDLLTTLDNENFAFIIFTRHPDVVNKILKSLEVKSGFFIIDANEIFQTRNYLDKFAEAIQLSLLVVGKALYQGKLVFTLSLRI
jgi:hypothetical protein